MAIQKKEARSSAAKNPGRSRKAVLTDEAPGTVLSTASGPSTAQLDTDSPLLATEPQRRLARQKSGAQALAAARRDNPLKAGEHGAAGGHAPQAGVPVKPLDAMDTASTVSEDTVSAKTGAAARPGHNPANESLERVRVDSGGQALTTNMGRASATTRTR